MIKLLFPSVMRPDYVLLRHWERRRRRRRKRKGMRGRKRKGMRGRRRISKVEKYEKEVENKEGDEEEVE